LRFVRDPPTLRPAVKRPFLLLALGFAVTTLAFAEEKSAPAPKTAPRMPDSVKLKADLPYAGNTNPRQALDLYLQKKPASDKPLPVVVSGCPQNRGKLNQLYPQNLSSPVVRPRTFHPQTRMNTGLPAFFRSD
jgi:hypothetical protein